MKPTLALAFLSILAGARVASAQPGPGGSPDAPTPPPDGTTVTTPPAPPTPPPAPPPEPVAAEQHAMRPEGFSVGMGLGWDLPTSIQQPNVTSVRFRLASGLTIEPIFTLAGTSTSSDNGPGTNTTDKTGDLALAAVVRIPHRIHDRVDLELVGAAGVGLHTDDPMGDNNNTTTSDVRVSWGLGLEYWLTGHWSVSLTATNPLLDAQHSSTQQGAGLPDHTTGTTSFGLIWDPNVVLMTHLYL
jgi:hypothetical protein